MSLTLERAKDVLANFFNEGGFDAGFDEEALRRLASHHAILDGDLGLLRHEMNLLKRGLDTCVWSRPVSTGSRSFRAKPDASWVAGLREPTRP